MRTHDSTCRDESCSLGTRTVILWTQQYCPDQIVKAKCQAEELTSQLPPETLPPTFLFVRLHTNVYLSLSTRGRTMAVVDLTLRELVGKSYARAVTARRVRLIFFSVPADLT